MHRQLHRSWAIALSAHLLLFAVAARAQNLQCPPPSQCQFRVLAIGDSLTKGAVPSEQKNHPYTIKLQQLLKAKFGSRATASVTTAAYNFMGVIQKAKDDNGQTINLTLVPYLQSTLQQAKQKGYSYQWVILMAGINDLGNSNQTAAAVMPKLIEAYKLALDSGANVMAIAPFPNRFVSRDSKNERERLQLLQLMRQYVDHQAGTASSDCNAPRVYLLQLPAEEFNFWTMPAGRVKQMQDDLLHLTPLGYDRLGGLVFDALSQRVPLRECLCPVKQTAPAAPAAPRPAASGANRPRLFG